MLSLPLPNNKHFADISGYQPAINWSQYRTFSNMIAMKATEGIGFTDPTFITHRNGALAAGIETIWFYHFARPEFGNNPTNEAWFFRGRVGTIRPADRVILDIETGTNTASWSLAFVQELESFYHGQIGIYSYANYVAQNLQNPALAAYPLWFALYNPVEPSAPAPWKSLAAWQFSDAFQVPGIGACDCSVLLEESSMDWSAINTMIVLLWNSQEAYFKALGQPLPPRDTGIFGVWRQALLDGHFKGVPLSAEYPITDPDGSGDPCVAQNFAGGTCRWNKKTNQATWI